MTDKPNTRSKSKFNIILNQLSTPTNPAFQSTGHFGEQSISTDIPQTHIHSPIDEVDDDSSIYEENATAIQPKSNKDFGENKEEKSEAEDSLQKILNKSLAFLEMQAKEMERQKIEKIQRDTGLDAIRNMQNMDNCTRPNRKGTGAIPKVKNRESHSNTNRTAATLEHARFNMANITLQDSFLTPRTPATPKFLCPSTFNPCTHSAESFLKQYERTSAANGWDNGLKMAYFQSFLEGAANVWFERYRENRNNTDKTWEEVKQDFLLEYGLEEQKRTLERNLYHRKQGPIESIKSYYYDLQALFGEYDPSYNVEEFRKFFENGLRSELYPSYRLILDDNLDWKKLNKIVNKLEDISQTTKSFADIQKSMNSKNDQKCQHCDGNNESLNSQFKHSDNQGNYNFNPRQNQRFNQFENARNKTYYTSKQPQNQYNYQQTYRNGGYQQRKDNNKSQNNSYGSQQQGTTFYNNKFRQNNREFNSRTHDGRVRCYYCKKIGHHGSVCRIKPQNPNENRQH
jgi:Retrotransposon gag protein